MKKKLVVRVWYFERYDEEGTMNTVDLETEEEYNTFMSFQRGSIDIFDEKEVYVDAEGEN